MAAEIVNKYLGTSYVDALRHLQRLDEIKTAVKIYWSGKVRRNKTLKGYGEVRPINVRPVHANAVSHPQSSPFAKPNAASAANIKHTLGFKIRGEQRHDGRRGSPRAGVHIVEELFLKLISQVHGLVRTGLRVTEARRVGAGSIRHESFLRRRTAASD